MNFVIVRSFDNYIDANITLGRLQSEGVQGFLRDEYTVTIDPILSNAIGGIKLTVREQDAPKAMELLEGFDREKRAFFKCPNCGSNDVEFISTSRKASNWFSAILSFLIGSYAIAPNKVYHCFNCGHEFKELNNNGDSQSDGQ